MEHVFCKKHPEAIIVEKEDGGAACMACFVEALPVKDQVGWFAFSDDEG